MHEADIKTERWRPYVTWAKSISAAKAVNTHHSVLYFNYDLVPEKLNAVYKCFDIRPNSDKGEDGMARVFKLHGSVNWRLALEGEFGGRAKFRIEVVKRDDFPAVAETGSEIAIAVPGPSKAEMCEDQLKQTWSDALAAVQEASTIIFMGYRFPPSDSMSLDSICRAISQNTAEEKLSIHTVLGDDDASRRRLDGLLLHALAATRRHDHVKDYGRVFSPDPKWYVLKHHHMFTQDYLTVAG